MGFPFYLAMTASEIRRLGAEGPIAWLACRFSPRNSGLCSLPHFLPEGSLLILTDEQPIAGHDPLRVAWELEDLLHRSNCRGVLLDFQRPDSGEAAVMAAHLVSVLPYPVGVSSQYAGTLSCPVCLPPVPADEAVRDHLKPWQSREIWLEMGLDAVTLVLTAEGCRRTPLPHFSPEVAGFADEILHCHYSVQAGTDSARFTLWRTREDVRELLEDTHGVSLALGLWQELGND